MMMAQSESRKIFRRSRSFIDSLVVQNINQIITRVLTNIRTISISSGNEWLFRAGDCVLLSPMSEPEPVRDWARGSGKSDGLAPSLRPPVLIGARAAGEIHTRCMVAGPDPDIRAHHCHHKQRFYLLTWHPQVKEKRKSNTNTEKSVIILSASGL